MNGRLELVALTLAKPGIWLGTRNHLVMSSRRWQRGSNAWAHMESTMYLALQVLKAIWDC